MRIIRAADCRKMPWKNGGGETTEIAVSPHGAGIDDFDWRLSMARVESSGPFSSFTGVDRTLAILEGEGLVLAVSGQEPVELNARSIPLSFPADAPTAAQLLGRAVTDLNMMTRRGRKTHSMKRLSVTASSVVETKADELLLFCRTGKVRIGDREGVSLGPLDTLHIQEAPDDLHIQAAEPAELFLVEIARIA